MSEMTTADVLKLLERAAAEGEQVDLHGRDLRGIDLSARRPRRYAQAVARQGFRCATAVSAVLRRAGW